MVKALSEDEEAKDKPRIMITSVNLKGPWDSYPRDEWLACYFLLEKTVLPDDLLKHVELALTRR